MSINFYIRTLLICVGFYQKTTIKPYVLDSRNSDLHQKSNNFEFRSSRKTFCYSALLWVSDSTDNEEKHSPCSRTSALPLPETLISTVSPFQQFSSTVVLEPIEKSLFVCRVLTFSFFIGVANYYLEQNLKIQ